MSTQTNKTNTVEDIVEKFEQQFPDCYTEDILALGGNIPQGYGRPTKSINNKKQEEIKQFIRTQLKEMLEGLRKPNQEGPGFFSTDGALQLGTMIEIKK